MLWRLLVAAVALSGFLGGATLLAAQLERDIASGYGVGGGLTEAPDLLGGPPPGVKPFTFDGLSLPKDVPMTIPEGSIVNPDGSITLPDGSQIPVDGATFKDIAMTLPQDGALRIPEGTVFDPSTGKLTFPEGLGDNATIDIPDVGQFQVPPGSDLVLPPDIARNLESNGFRGELPDMDLRLPGGSEVSLPKVPATGDLTAQDGTKIVPPTGRNLNLPPGRVNTPTDVTLPAGTQIDQNSPVALLAGIAYVGATQAGITPGSIPPPLPGGSGSGGSGSSGGGGGSGSTGNQTSSQPPATPVLVYSEAVGVVEKGKPFQVAGYVRNTPGQGLAGVPVDVFVNQSESTPGTKIGSAVTRADGTFAATVSIPSNLPAGEYYIMANSKPTRIGSTLYAGGWG